MPETKRSEVDADREGEEAEVDAFDLEGLRLRGEVGGILALARAYRSGSAPGGRDLRRCLEAYRAAAELGSADAEYAVALFSMSGGVVAQDLKEGTSRLRAAAEKGSVAAKVYLANLYELGIHYKADKEKADVWYRNAARGAGIEPVPGSDDHVRELAELGCVRHVLELIEKGAVDEGEKAHLLQRARAHGYGLKLKDGVVSTDRPTFLNALEGAEAPESAPDATTPMSGEKLVAPKEKPSAEKQAAQRPPVKAKGEEKGPKASEGALGAFAYALLFVITGVGAGYAATVGARELVAHGQVLPAIGTRTQLVFPIVLALVGVLPTSLVYRVGTVVKALVVAAALAGVGWVAWGTGQAAFHADRATQAAAFGIGGFLPALLVLGLLGGTKKKTPRPRRHLSG